MKWVALLILFGSIQPAVSWLRKNPSRLSKLCIAIGLLPFVTGWLHLLSAPISWPMWIGPARGVEIWVLDVVSIVIVLYLRGRLITPPFTLFMTLYLLANLAATTQADVPMASVFYCWQILRVFLLYFVVTNVCAIESGAVGGILTGLGIGEILQCVMALYERFGLHVLQTWGTMGSQNELGLASHFVVFPFFALMLGGRRGWLPAAAVFAGMISYVMTTSRGAVLLGLAGLGLVWLLSSAMRPSARKLKVMLAGLAVLAVIAPVAIGSFAERFSKNSMTLEEDTERVSFQRAAELMREDHPAGIGPNQFAVVGNAGGYYSRVVNISSLGRASNVHNIYILIWTETGILGLITYFLVILPPVVMGFRNGFLSRRLAGQPTRDILIGASVTLVIVYIHSKEEWVMISSEMQYLMAIAFGLIAGISSEARVAARSSGRIDYRYSNAASPIS